MSSSGQVIESAIPARYGCDLCPKTFRRLDHVWRHKEGHTNKRPFICPTCSKGFNRADLLERHKNVHKRRSRPSSTPNGPKRALQACQGCIAAKTKCSDHKPCQRCRSRGNRCVVRVLNGTNRVNIEEPPLSPDGSQATTNTLSPPIGVVLSDRSSTSHDDVDNMAFIDPGTHEAFSNDTGQEALSAHLALPDHSYFDLIQGIGLDFESMGVDFFGVFGGTPCPLVPGRPGHQASTSSATILRSARYEAFKKSPWLWDPARNDNAIAAQEALTNLDSTILEQLGKDELTYVQRLQSDNRDQLLGMLFETSRLTIPKIKSFPSTGVLNHLVQLYFQDSMLQTDNWIHAASFDPRDVPVQLIGALVAAGTQRVDSCAVWKMGLALQESVRLSVSALIEADNTWGRDVHFIQAYRLWLDVGLFSGFRRKIEIAEGYGQITGIMLRRAGVFNRSYYSTLISEKDRGSETVHEKWKRWVKLESMKRLAIHTFITDVQTSIAFLKAAPMTTLNFSLPVPASNALWLASTANQWNETYCDDQYLPNIIEVVQDLSLLDHLINVADMKLTLTLILYEFWSQIWSYHNTGILRLSSQSSEGQDPGLMWRSHQYNQLYLNLNIIRTRLTTLDHAFQECMAAEFFMMSLHVSIFDLQQVCGMSGEHEASNAFQTLQQNWFPTRDARIAIWHAGQVLRAARSVPSTLLRDFLGIALLQASLCLRVYGLLSESDDSTVPPGVDELSTTDSSREFQVTLDSVESPEQRTFVEFGHGIPCVTHDLGKEQRLVPLKDRSSGVVAARAILSNHFSTSGAIPALTQKLLELMKALGDAD